MIGKLRAGAAPACALALVLGGWHLAELPAGASAQDARLAKQFAFARQPLNQAVTGRDVRTVAPAFRHISSWISAVGAAVGVADLDGNGRSDDVCLVDPRDDSATVRPAPGTGGRFRTMRLTPGGLPYDATMAPMGCVPGDYNEDGLTDVLIYYWGRSPVLFLRTPGSVDRRDAFTPRELVRPYQVWNTNAITLADVDGDGHSDIVAGNYFPDGARVLDPHARQDELRMQRSMSAGYNGGVNRILLSAARRGGSRPDARFRQVPTPFSDTIARAWTLAIGAQDLDGDGRAELYFANDFGPDHLLQNRSTPGRVRLKPLSGRRHATTPKSKVLGNDSFKGMGVTFPDINRDDVPDMIVSNITENYALHESNFAWLSTGRPAIGADGTARFDDHSESLGISRSGWGWDIKAADFAGTGDTQIMQATGFVAGHTNRWPELQELAMANDDRVADPRSWPRFRPGDDVSGHDPNRFFVRGPDGRFRDIAARIGVADRKPARGIGLADVDHDGRLDFAVANQWGQSYFYRNTRAADHPFLGLRLLVPATAEGDCAGPAHRSRPAVGAAVRLRSGAAGVRTGQVYPANGHGGVSAPELLFALTNRQDRVPATIGWRDQCGTRHTAEVHLAPGWHSLLLGADGSAKEVTP